MVRSEDEHWQRPSGASCILEELGESCAQRSERSERSECSERTTYLAHLAQCSSCSLHLELALGDTYNMAVEDTEGLSPPQAKDEARHALTCFD